MQKTLGAALPLMLTSLRLIHYFNSNKNVVGRIELLHTSDPLQSYSTVLCSVVCCVTGRVRAMFVMMSSLVPLW